MIKHAQHIAGWATFLLLVAAVVVALIAEPLQISLVRLLEGYWGQSLAGRLLAAPGTAFHRARRRRLDARQRRGPHEGPVSPERREQAARRLRDYPPADAVLPTKLGNVLRAAEYQAGRSYGLDAISLWPRLYPLLADKTAAVVDDLRDQLSQIAPARTQNGLRVEARPEAVARHRPRPASARTAGSCGRKDKDC